MKDEVLQHLKQADAEPGQKIEATGWGSDLQNQLYRTEYILQHTSPEQLLEKETLSDDEVQAAYLLANSWMESEGGRALEEARRQIDQMDEQQRRENGLVSRSEQARLAVTRDDRAIALLPPELQQQARTYLGLYSRVGLGTRFDNRVLRVGESTLNNTVGSVLALSEIGYQAAKNWKSNRDNPEWVAMNEERDRLIGEGMNMLYSGGAYLYDENGQPVLDDMGRQVYSEEYLAGQRRAEELAYLIEAIDDDTPVDPDRLGQQMMAHAARAREVAQVGLSGGAKVLSDWGQAGLEEGIDFAADMFFPGAGRALSAVRSAGTRSYELSQAGYAPDAAFGGGTTAGLIDFSISLPGMDELTDAVRVGNRPVVQQVLKKVVETNRAVPIFGIVSDMGTGAMEGVLEYAANYVVDNMQGIENEFDMEELAQEAIESAMTAWVSGGLEKWAE